MKPNQRGRFNNGRYGNNTRGARSQTIFRNTSLESTGPCGKLRGTALQLHEKYLAAAKDAQIQNDDVLAETCFQYADHYMHMQNIAIANEQALHAQQQAARQQAEADIRAISEAPIAVEEKTEESTVSGNESSLKVVDLSVPVEAMNQQAAVQSEDSTPQRPVLKTRRIPRSHSPKASKATETPITESEKQ